MTPVFLGIFTLGIFAAWLLWLAPRLRGCASETLVYAGLLMACQIVLSEILLGVEGRLELGWLLGLNLLVSGAVFGWALLRGNVSAALHHWRGALTGPADDPDLGIRVTNALLAVLVAITLMWALFASWLLPTRGIDDVTYHLPPIYEYAQSGQIKLLPLNLRDQFGMPLGGEFLFLWPLVLIGTDTWIDFVQFAVASFGAIVLYAIARAFKVPRSYARFSAALFLLTPIVLAQAGSNYVDVVVVTIHLVLLFAVLRFWQTGLLVHLTMAGLASGFALGVKYHLLAAVLAVQPLIFLRIWRDDLGAGSIVRLGAYLAALIPLPAYWYGRNLLVLGYPLYPYDLSLSGLRSLEAAPMLQPGVVDAPGGAVLQAILDAPGRFVMYLFQDPGLGTLNGGFGLAFWGLGMPAFLVTLGGAVWAIKRRDVFPLLFWGQALCLAFVVFMQIDINRLRFNMRLLIILVPVALLALALLLPRLRRAMPWSVPLVGAVGVLSSLLAVAQMGNSGLPAFGIADAVADRNAGRYTSSYRYYMDSVGDLPRLASVWDPLDYLTAPDAGMDVYIAAARPVYWTSPLFGTYLQNRVLNLQLDLQRNDGPKIAPDAFVFHPVGTAAKLLYIGPRITPDNVALDGRYELISPEPETQLWVSRERLAREPMRRRLVDFYARRYPEKIDALRSVLGGLPNEGVLVVASPLGPALKYLSMTGELRIPVLLSPPALISSIAGRSRAPVVFTLDSPLPGTSSMQVASLSVAGTELSVFRNESPR